MRLQTFIDKFDLFTAAPNAVAKMRHLILQLAMRGKLVEQRSEDGDAGDLLNTLAELKAGKSGKTQGTIIFENQLTDDQQWHKVPASWGWVRLGTLGDIVGGGTPRSDNGAYFAEEGISWLTPADLTGYKAKYISQGRRFITPLGLKKSSTQLLPAGTVLFSSRAPIGYVAISACELATNQGFKSCVPYNTEMSEYIYYALMAAAPRIDREASGTTFREVSGRVVNQIPIPVPPLAEQKRIVSKLDELLALCDRLEVQQAERDSQQAALVRASLTRFTNEPSEENLGIIFHDSYTIPPLNLRSIILTLAIQGKLVPQNPTDKPASEQIREIQFRKEELIAEKKIRRSDPSRPIDQQELEYTIPDSWAWVRLIDLCEIITDGTHQTPKYTDSGRIFLSAQNVKPFKFMPEKHRFVSEEDYQSYIKNRKPERSDILLTRVGAGIGEAATIDQDLDFAIYVSIGLIRPVRGLVFSDYITLWLNSPDGTEKSSRHTYGKGTSQGNLNLSLIRNFLVPLPPLAEQYRIVAKAHKLMVLVDQLELHLATANATSVSLMEAVVAELIS